MQSRAERRAWEAQYRKRNREKLNAKQRAWTERNRERETARLKASYLKHREAALKRSKERYERTRERKLQLAAEWRKRNPGKMRQYTDEWRKRNRGKYLGFARIGSHKRRDINRGAGACDPISINVLTQLIRSAVKMRCAICNQNMKVDDRSIDHVIPISKGGTGDIGNLQVVHRSCNAKKYAKMPHEIDGQMQIHLVGGTA